MELGNISVYCYTEFQGPIKSCATVIHASQDCMDIILKLFISEN